MKTDFINEIIRVKDIPAECPYEPVILENNEKQIEDICNFLQNDNKLMLINGFKGTGKSLVCDFILSQVKSEVLILQYKCFETTILDDLLLAFFEIFRKYTLEGRIEPPKIKVDNFTQKINSYFNHIGAPIIVVINSFESVLKSNRQDILNFIFHLSKLPNVKIIITSRKFNDEDFNNINFDKTTILALSKDLFEKYLKSNNIKQIGVLSNELYKQTKGYYNNIKISVDIMKLRGYNISDFLELFSKSLIAFPDFVVREALSIVDPVSTHLFRLLAMMRIPIHINLLNSLNLYNEERENFFIDNSVLFKDDKSLYLDETLREVVERQIPDNVAQKLHRSCIDLYNTQLPLKPLERDLKLSRQTMRNEIEYHSLFLPKKVVIPSTNPLEVKAAEVQTQPQLQEPEESKEEKIKKINFIIEDEAVLDNIADSIKDFVSQKSETQELAEQSSGLGVTKLINLARKAEANYNFKHAILLYQNALTKKDDEDFLKFLPVIYISLAQDYKHLSRWYEALEYYTQAQDFYYNASNNEKTAEAKLEIANIYYIIYKNENAKVILNELEKDKTLPNELQIKINLALGKLTDTKQAYKYYKNSLELIDNTISKPVIAELYYKFGASNDELGSTKTAVKYYKQCIDIDFNPQNNPYISQALSSLAEIYDEAGAPDTATKYYLESIKIDSAAKNYNGLYGSARSLAEIYSPKASQKSLEWLTKALDYAKKLNEPFYVTDTAIEIGNHFLLRKEYEKAYKYFALALYTDNMYQTKINSENIKSKIGIIEQHIPNSEFQTLKAKYDK